MIAHPPPRPPTSSYVMPTAPASSAPRVVPSTALFEGQRELIIQHGSDSYRLRVTASGKLILTK
jgi:hemin uptake protein HemP